MEIKEGDIISAKMKYGAEVGRVYLVDDKKVCFQDVWGSSYTVSKRRVKVLSSNS